MSSGTDIRYRGEDLFSGRVVRKSRILLVLAPKACHSLPVLSVKLCINGFLHAVLSDPELAPN